MRKNLREMSKEEVQREWTWTLVEIALLLLAVLLITMGSWWGVPASMLFVYVLLRPNRGTL